MNKRSHAHTHCPHTGQTGTHDNGNMCKNVGEYIHYKRGFCAPFIVCLLCRCFGSLALISIMLSIFRTLFAFVCATATKAPARFFDHKIVCRVRHLFLLFEFCKRLKTNVHGFFRLFHLPTNIRPFAIDVFGKCKYFVLSLLYFSSFSKINSLVLPLHPPNWLLPNGLILCIGSANLSLSHADRQALSLYIGSSVTVFISLVCISERTEKVDVNRELRLHRKKTFRVVWKEIQKAIEAKSTEIKSKKIEYVQ